MDINIILNWVFFSATVVLAAFAGYLYGKRKRAIEKASEKNVLEKPADFNEKYRYNESLGRGNHFMQKFEMVTVMLADIEGFSQITDDVDPETLMNELNNIFFYFDSHIDRYQVEKIKTMGDSYMCAGGILYKNHTNPMDVVLLALDVQNHQKKLSEKNPNVWSLRVGIHTGPVIAGMLGQKKLTFDIWGHTVNVAARLEADCESGKINISQTTYEKIKDYFDCEYHGIAPRTNEPSYFVKGLKPEFVQTNSDGLTVPNNAFLVKMQLLRIIDLEEYVVNIMTNIASNMYFHNVTHIMDVCEQITLLSRTEGIKDEDVLLLQTAALLHDIGYAITYDDDISTVSENIAREFLPSFQYKPHQIDRICDLMKIANYDSIPNGIVEEVMHDANHMYYGRTDYVDLMKNLFRELEEHNIQINKTDWFLNQINRLANHKFYTQTAKKMVEVTVDQQINNLKNEI